MTKKPKPKPVKVLNPRYAGATPEMVGKALLNYPSKPVTRQKGKPKVEQTFVRSSI